MAVFCKLKNMKIDVDECYDIQMVRNGYIRSDMLSSETMINDASSICPFCKYCQLPEGNEIMDVLSYIKNELPFPSQISKDGFVIHFHDDFVLEYNWNEQFPHINGKRFYSIDIPDIEDWIRQFAGGYDVIIQYKNRLFPKVPFKLIDANKFKIKHPLSKSVEKIFSVSEVLYDKNTFLK